MLCELILFWRFLIGAGFSLCLYLGEIGVIVILPRSCVAGPPSWGQGVTAWYQSVSYRLLGFGVESGSGSLELRLEEATVLPLEWF